jgi:phage terminase large subunit-like protein
VIHAGELLPDGRPRFRTVLVLVARQNGKTHALKVLGLYWQFVEMWPLILGMSTNLDYAREAWEKACSSLSRTRPEAPRQEHPPCQR